MSDLFEEEAPEIESLLPFDGSGVLHRQALAPEQGESAFAALLEHVPWEQREVQVFGRRFPQPRLIAWFGEPGRVYRYSGLRLEPRPWIQPLAELKALCERLAGCTFDSALANLYRDGRDSVSWHADDEPVLGDEPTIASLSLGAERRFDLRHRETRETIRTVLPAGSVLVLSGACQRCWVHQVPKTARPVGPRINVTFRAFARLPES